MTRSTRIAACAVVAAIACGSGKEGGASDDMSMAMYAGTGGVGVAPGSGGMPGVVTMMGSGGQLAPTTMMGNAGGGSITKPMGGAGDGTGDPVVDAGGGGDDGSACPSCPIPSNCQGFKLEGLQYSPGG